MLILSRKTRESVVVGGSDGFVRVLKVTVLEIRGDRVRLGFEVDRDLPVHRWEVWERMQATNSPESFLEELDSQRRDDVLAPEAAGELRE